MKCVNVVNSLPFWFSERMGHCFHVLGVGKGGYLEKKKLASRMHLQRSKVP